MKARLLLKRITLICCVFFFIPMTSQNLLDQWLPWSIGSGSITGFSRNGSTVENVRVNGYNHIGENVILWRGGNEPDNASDGGWNTWYLTTINNTKTYRFSVWIKKTNSNNGHTYFGCQQWASSPVDAIKLRRLNGNYQNNPYFWVGDLPELDKWYLLVGYVHHKDYSGTSNQGGIYDGVTGELVQNITDFKFYPTTTKIRHRAYLYYDTDVNDRQYFSDPWIEVVDGSGSERTLNEMLSINENSILKFTYDTAGNQTERKYCATATCSSRIGEEIKSKEAITENLETIDEIEDSFESLSIFPNPTKSDVTIRTSSERMINRITVFDVKGSLLQTIDYDKSSSSFNVNMSRWPVGIYYLHLHTEDGESTTKKIIKN